MDVDVGVWKCGLRAGAGHLEEMQMQMQRVPLVSLGPRLHELQLVDVDVGRCRCRCLRRAALEDVTVYVDEIRQLQRRWGSIR